MSFLDNLFAQSSSTGGLSDTASSDIAESKGFLSTIASAVTSSRMAVDLTTAVTGYLQTLAGAVATGNMKVLLQAGSAAIGKLATNVGVNIGTVDLNNALQLPATIGQRNMATSLGVAIANDQSPIPVTGSGTPLPVQGSVVVTSGLVTVANTVVANLGTSLPAGSANIGQVNVPQLPAALGQQIPANSLSVINASGSVSPVSLTGSLPAGGANIGRVDVNSLPALPAGTNQIGTVDLASIPTNNLAILASIPSTAAVSVVPASASVVTLAFSNAARTGLLVINNSTSTSALLLKLGSGASLTSWSVSIDPGGYWEMPRRYYSGIVTGIWSNATGDAHVTET